MANIQISGLTAVSSLTSGDVFALDQSVGNLSKKITTANLAAAIVTTTNVTAAGALMDSEIINLAQVKSFDSSDYATAAQGTTADNALPTTGGAMTGAITTTSTFDGRDVATDGTKLDGIEAGADVTDTANVTAAGALMDSELTSIADVKALNQSLVIGAAPVLDATNMTNIPSGGILIGDSIGGATNNTVLYANLNGNLWSNSKFTFDGGSLNFTGESTTSITSTSFGGNAGSGNTGLRNTSIGYQANSNSTGGNITSIGYRAGGFAGSADDSEFIGYEAGYNGSGNRVVFIGYKSGYSYSALNCVGVGDHSLYDTHGIHNVAIGTNSQNSSGTGAYNTSVGHNSLLSSANKSNNSALGWSAGSNNTGNDILALGYNAGKSNAQSNRTIIGQSNLPVFSGELAAAAALPAAGTNGVYLYWDDTDNTIKARP